MTRYKKFCSNTTVHKYSVKWSTSTSDFYLMCFVSCHLPQIWTPSWSNLWAPLCGPVWSRTGSGCCWSCWPGSSSFCPCSVTSWNSDAHHCLGPDLPQIPDLPGPKPAAWHLFRGGPWDLLESHRKTGGEGGLTTDPGLMNTTGQGLWRSCIDYGPGTWLWRCWVLVSRRCWRSSWAPTGTRWCTGGQGGAAGLVCSCIVS